MLGGSEEKLMFHTSAIFHVIILITWILTDTRRSNNIQKKIKFVQIRPDLYWSCTKELSVVRGQAFLSSIKEMLRLSSSTSSVENEWLRLIVTMLFE